MRSVLDICPSIVCGANLPSELQKRSNKMRSVSISEANSVGGGHATLQFFKPVQIDADVACGKIWPRTTGPVQALSLLSEQLKNGAAGRCLPLHYGHGETQPGQESMAGVVSCAQTEAKRQFRLRPVSRLSAEPSLLSLQRQGVFPYGFSYLRIQQVDVD